MSARGGKRSGSGRKLLSPDSSESRQQQQKDWRQGHARIYLKKNVHATWKNLKRPCVYASDNAFAEHLLSLELRRQARKTGYTARKRLAVIDWNYHLDVKTKKNSYGEVSVTRKYNQRTKKWNLKIVKEEKDYGYIWMLLAKIFRLRFEDEKNMQQIVPMNVDDPRKIAATIAQCESVSARELYEKHHSRFTQEN